jgi:DNA-binding transcriptional ArsR family regulator
VSGMIEPGNPVQGAIVGLTRELSDPVRLTALQLLAAEGPHTMVQLADALGVTAPRLGNHLARLRAAGLVTVEHTGRHALYRVGRDDLLPVLTALARYGGNGSFTPPRPAESTVDTAHTCYDHTAGRLGVAVFAMLVDRGALRPPDGSAAGLTLGRDASAFHDLGVDPATVDPGRRRLATACLDRTNRVPHLGGVLGHEVLEAFLAAGWVRRGDGDRELAITPRGSRRLGALGLDPGTTKPAVSPRPPAAS